MSSQFWYRALSNQWEIDEPAGIGSLQANGTFLNSGKFMSHERRLMALKYVLNYELALFNKVHFKPNSYTPHGRVYSN